MPRARRSVQKMCLEKEKQLPNYLIMSAVNISYESFTLPFFGGETDLADDDDETAGDLASFEGKIPRSAIFLGQAEAEVSNWTTWMIRDHFYLIPWETPEFDWALFRISWNDNWECYEWCGDARLKGLADPKEAARQMAKGLFANWGIDFRRSENRPFRNFLAGL